MKIRAKLFSVITALSILGIGILTGILLYYSQAYIKQVVNENAFGVARENALALGIRFDKYFGIVRTLAQVMQNYETIPINERRIFLDMMLENVTRSNPGITGAWSIWEPNVLDGRDSEFVNSKASDSTGRFISYWGANAAGVVDVYAFENISKDEGYYNEPKRTGNEYVDDPFWYELNGKKVFMTRINVPIKSNGRFVGVVGIDVDIAEIQELISSVKPFGTGNAISFSYDGTVVSHYQADRIGKNMHETERDLDYNKVARVVNNDEEYIERIWSNSSKSYRDIIMVPIHIGNTKTPWILSVAVLEKTIMAAVDEMRFIGIGLGLIIVMVMGVGAIFIAHGISKPIVYSMKTLKVVSEGDLTQEIKIDSRDEQGDFANYLNFTLHAIRSLIAAIKKQSDSMNSIGRELETCITETASSMDTMNTGIKDMKTQTTDQDIVVKETSANVEHTMQQIDSLNEHISSQAESVSRSSAAIEEMLANIHSVVETLMKNDKNVQLLKHSSEVGKKNLNSVSDGFAEIARESEGLLEINAVMESIASQTNLLSMNAAIEAAHAGESGKGFAVVADEIRKLAESSSEQSKTTTEVLKKIKAAIDSMTQSITTVLSGFEEIETNIKVVSDMEQVIRSSMEEQEVGSKQILDSVSNLHNITDIVKRQSIDMAKESELVLSKNDKLRTISVSVNKNMDNIKSGAERIDSSMNKVSKISDENAANIEILAKELAKFKV
ncbi:methyl-accepting chemotaxis protein [Breznakiellaceae bacterium SP9]